jgi:itaconyl-CoA hydratase
VSATDARGRLAQRTGEGTWFEDFRPGDRWRHARGATIDEVENQLLTKLVCNTAQEHWNEHAMATSPWGNSRIVFGMITGSLTVGLSSQDTAENALAELGLDTMRFRAPVFHGDTLYACTEVLTAEPAPDRPDAGVVRFRHWGLTGSDRLVFECERTVLVKRRSYWRSR